MNGNTTAWTRIGGYLARVTAGLSRRNALTIVGVLFAGVLYVITVAPAEVGFAVTVVLAAAWCSWLADHAKPSVSEPLDR